MSRQTLENLAEWMAAPKRPRADYRAARMKSRDRRQENYAPDEKRRPSVDNWHPRAGVVRQPVLCRVVEIGEGHEVICAMEVGGRELPRVSFPASVLRAKKLGKGARFIWWMPESGEVLRSDIDTDVPPDSEVMTDADQARIEELHAQMKANHDKHGPWPVFTGDGK